MGVDLERVRAIPTHLARHFLTSDEASASGGDITVLWALKEAAWKALGLGRSVPFKDVQLLCDASGRLGGVSVCGSAMRMSSHLSTPWPGYVMAVVWSEGGTA